MPHHQHAASLEERKYDLGENKKIIPHAIYHTEKDESQITMHQTVCANHKKCSHATSSPIAMSSTEEHAMCHISKESS